MRKIPMRLGLTKLALLSCATSIACTSLDIPAGPDEVKVDNGDPTSVGQDAGKNGRDDAGAPEDGELLDGGPVPSDSNPTTGPVAATDSGRADRDASKPAVGTDAGTTAPPTQVKDAGKVPVSPPTTKPDAGSGTTETDAGSAPPVTNNPGPTAPPVTMMSVVPGSAIKGQCSSYGTGASCNGYYCGVTMANLVAEMPADTLCGSGAASIACDNALFLAVSRCSRSTKSANVLATNEELRPLIKQCLLRDTAYQTTPDACLSCYLEQTECSNDKCLVDCLNGDSKGCDACRVKNGCHTKATLCAKLPNPF
jgi:hypothetical protein